MDLLRSLGTAIKIVTPLPGLRKRGGSNPIPTPAGVPVAIMSPGSSVRPAEIARHKASEWGRSGHGVCALSQLAIYAAFNIERSRIDLVSRHDPWPHRAEGVERLSGEPLLVIALSIAGRDVVDDRVAPDVIEGAGRQDVSPALADDHRELRFVVDRRGDVRMQLNCISRTDNRARRLGEDRRVLVDFGA